MSEWQPIDGHGGRYFVSAQGEVKRDDGRMVGQWQSDQGYMLVRLSSPRSTHRVHRLVAAAFVPNPDNLPCVNHLDFDRANNRSSNLEWCIQRHNLMHSRVSGRMRGDYWKGRRSPNAHLSDAAAQEIRAMYAAGGHSLSEVARCFGASKRTVERVVKGKSYV